MHKSIRDCGVTTSDHREEKKSDTGNPTLSYTARTSAWKVVKRDVKVTLIELIGTRASRQQQIRSVPSVKRHRTPSPSRPQPPLYPGPLLSIMTGSTRCTWSACVHFRLTYTAVCGRNASSCHRNALVAAVAVQFDEERGELKICALSSGQNETLCPSPLSPTLCGANGIELTDSSMAETLVKCGAG